MDQNTQAADPALDGRAPAPKPFIPPDTGAQRDLAKSETEIFGDKPLRGPDGEPMERGAGSRFANMTPAARAHYHVLASAAAVEEVLSLAKQLADAATRLGAAHKTAVTSAAEAKTAAPPPVEPAKEG